MHTSAPDEGDSDSHSTYKRFSKVANSSSMLFIAMTACRSVQDSLLNSEWSSR